MTLKDRIIEHVKTSPFRHRYMIFVVVVGTIVLSIADMFAMIGAAHVLSTSTGNTMLIYIASEIAIYGLTFFIFGLVAYLGFIQIAHMYLLHKKVAVYEEHKLDGPVMTAYSYGKLILTFGAIFYILGINQRTLTMVGLVAGTLITLYAAPYIIPKPIGDRMVAFSAYIEDCVAGRREFKFY